MSEPGGNASRQKKGNPHAEGRNLLNQGKCLLMQTCCLCGQGRLLDVSLKPTTRRPCLLHAFADTCLPCRRSVTRMLVDYLQAEYEADLPRDLLEELARGEMPGARSGEDIMNETDIADADAFRIAYAYATTLDLIQVTHYYGEVLYSVKAA